MKSKIDGILQEAKEYLDDYNQLRIAGEFGLDAPERISLVTQALLIKEARETNVMLDVLVTVLASSKQLFPPGEPPKPWIERLEQKLDEIEKRG
jgi:hypothetical protein